MGAWGKFVSQEYHDTGYWDISIIYIVQTSQGWFRDVAGFLEKLSLLHNIQSLVDMCTNPASFLVHVVSYQI